MTVYTQISQNNWPSTGNLAEDYHLFSITGAGPNGINPVASAIGSRIITPLPAVTNTGVLLSSAQSKYYGQSLSFNGSSSFLSLANNPRYSAANAAFTFEAWVYANSGSFTGTRIVFSQYISSSSSRFVVGVTNDGGYKFYHQVGNSYFPGNSVISEQTWYHVAWCRTAGGLMRMFVNGVLQSGTGTNAQVLPDLNLNIGRNGPGDNIGQYWSGYMNDLRVYGGIDKYTSGFNPPSQILRTF